MRKVYYNIVVKIKDKIMTLREFIESGDATTRYLITNYNKTVFVGIYEGVELLTDDREEIEELLTHVVEVWTIKKDKNDMPYIKMWIYNAIRA